MHFPDKAIEKEVLDRNLAPLRYVDDSNNPTETYPFNPNGSTQGIAALCSPDGRHLAIMPHPERYPTHSHPHLWSTFVSDPIYVRTQDLPEVALGVDASRVAYR